MQVEHVQLHRQARQTLGTLSLERHHLTFTYVQDEASQRTKKLWIPYPIISHCVLRPSHTYGRSVPRQAPDGSKTGSAVVTNGYLLTDAPQSPDGDGGAALDSSRAPSIRIRRKDFHMMAFHFHSPSADETARSVFFQLRSRCCVSRVEDLLAYHFQPPQEECVAQFTPYNALKEFTRMGIGPKASIDGPGAAWRITEINKDYSFSGTYPSLLCVPSSVSDNILKYGGHFRSKSRIPALTYLHFNGGSITRCSQPMTGVKGKRSPQDERLVSAIFMSHSPPEDGITRCSISAAQSTTSLASEKTETDIGSEVEDMGPETGVKPKVYGTSRRNLIVDARPRLNVMANMAGGGGIEDTSHYSVDAAVEKVFLNIENIHTMRASLQKVVDSLANSDYLDLQPNQDMLRRSGWLRHIALIIDGSELIARAVGLAGSHVLTHCSDGWDRTSQVSALAQIMLDPYYRTLDGFIVLIQKDFLSFGHKFRDRSGIMGSEKWFQVENERIQPSPSNQSTSSDPTNLQALGSKALAGAKTWWNDRFRQAELTPADSTPQKSNPPANPIIHSPATPNDKEPQQQRMDEKEVAPIFHQFLDSVYQLQRQYPSAFEFNERFLVRLLYHTYAGQYGEFLMNCERERVRQPGLPSVWPHFIARRAEFTSKDYTPHDALLLPKRDATQQVEIRWFSRLFGREDSEMNHPHVDHGDKT
ncbi:phosphatases II [Piedraia hortae CBS 480.64]|uniref:Phosphatases II n=1 Tax=Piedraia hortae CBS 480.64 TaxID=1314780 RepID=A0A6A7C5P6_9PEZI|nr:phosphatases II [Piedraia hortae CBS 480.64]